MYIFSFPEATGSPVSINNNNHNTSYEAVLFFEKISIFCDKACHTSFSTCMTRSYCIIDKIHIKWFFSKHDFHTSVEAEPVPFPILLTWETKSPLPLLCTWFSADIAYAQAPEDVKFLLSSIGKWLHEKAKEESKYISSNSTVTDNSRYTSRSLKYIPTNSHRSKRTCFCVDVVWR